MFQSEIEEKMQVTEMYSSMTLAKRTLDAIIEKMRRKYRSIKWYLDTGSDKSLQKISAVIYDKDDNVIGFCTG